MDNNESEKLKDKSVKNGGARPGAGRPKGSMNEASKFRKAAKMEFQRRVANHVDKIFHSQFDLALGEKYLMVKRVEGEGKNRKTWVEVVEDVGTIKDYIEDDGVSLNRDAGEDYYYMTTKPANNMALDSLLNRAFGKADESLDITSDGEKLEPVVIYRPEKLDDSET